MNEREEWILDYLEKHSGTDVTDEAFHDEFARKFNCKQKIKLWGACPCLVAMRLLKQMYDKRYIRRTRLGCEYQAGFPKWVYTYFI